MSITKKGVAVLAAITAVGAVPSAVLAGDKQDKGGDVVTVQGGYGWQHVVPAGLNVRTEPQGIAIGELKAGEHFNTQGFNSNGGWAFGRAYGNTNKCGWVDGYSDSGSSYLVQHDSGHGTPVDCGSPRVVPIS